MHNDTSCYLAQHMGICLFNQYIVDNPKYSVDADAIY
jgi:hypothetical protein